MTIVDEPKSQPRIDHAQLLFQEAKRRRRRRWWISGIVTSVFLVLLGITMGFTLGRGGGRSSRSVGIPALVAGPAHAGVVLNFRPVLCYAPHLTLAPGQAPSNGPLPPCSAATQLTASNLQVTPNANGVNGYTSNSNVRADSAFATYPSTTPSHDDKNDVVLLPGASAQGNARYVLGPAQLSGSAVRSSTAQLTNGQWAINLNLDAAGSATWDALSRQQFHQIIGIDLNGRIISAPLTQPTQSAWTSFNGTVQISGSFTEQQAKAIAADL